MNLNTIRILRKEKPSSSRGEQEPRRARIKTGRELTEVEEISARLSALVNLLAERGMLNVKEYERIVAMRLHEISKATAFEELEDEL
jgi:predicted transcriptional regulator YheO